MRRTPSVSRARRCALDQYQRKSPTGPASATGTLNRDLAQRVGDVVFGSKAGFGVPKIVLVEDDFDITDINKLVWAFASRAHPAHGEIHFRDEKSAYHTTKVVHNCLLGDRYRPEDRPIAVDLPRAWPAEIVRRVLTNWTGYGYPAPPTGAGV